MQIQDVAELEERLSEPTAALIEMMSRLRGDLIVLGVGGKMGPTLARMARRATDAAGVDRRIIGVSRFSDARLQQQLERQGIETIRGDLLKPEFVRGLPAAASVVSLVGLKFGTSGDSSLTWATNALVPGLIGMRYAGSRIVGLSTGNVYPLVPVDAAWSVETDPLGPVGEYAMSAVSREKMYEYASRHLGSRVSIIRLNYATELRYGVLVDLARTVHAEAPVSLAMGYANVIWQADASDRALRSLEYAASPAFILNVAGPELVECRVVCERFAERFDKRVEFVGSPAPTALLSDATKSVQLFGSPRLGLDDLVDLTADWILRDGETWNKPTHFEVRDGKF